MIKYIVKRLGIAVVMIIGVTMIIFCIIRMQPGNPFLHMVQADTNAEFMEAKLREIGYYDPLPIQYGKWLLRTLHFDLGYSIQYNAPVSGLILDRFSNTVVLATSSFLVSMVVAIAVGVFSALHPNTKSDYVITILSFICVSIPVFFFGLLLIKIFGYDLKILPFSGIETLGTHYTGAQRVLDIGKHLILPMTASAMTQTATLIRYTRASLMETVSEGYIDTATDINWCYDWSNCRLFWWTHRQDYYAYCGYHYVFSIFCHSNRTGSSYWWKYNKFSTHYRNVNVAGYYKNCSRRGSCNEAKRVYSGSESTWI